MVLQGIIRSLKEELGHLRGLNGGQDARETEIWHLREQVTRLASEKRELEAQLGRSREEALAGRAARQEAESLRGLVRGLELELRQERGLGGRAAGRRSQDCRRLAKEETHLAGWSQGGPSFIISGALHVSWSHGHSLLIAGEQPRSPGSWSAITPLTLTYR